jgi:drug/metabolite transporter (DMT)-like permease
MLNYGLVYAFLVLAFGGIDGILAKYIIKRLGKHRYALMVLGIGILPMLAYVAFAGIAGFGLGMLLLSLGSSTFLAAGYILYYKGVETQQITNISALGVVQPAIIFVFGILVLGEGMNSLEIAGGAAIFIGAALLLLTEKMEVNFMLVPIILANASWAVYWIIMSYAIASYGAFSMPLIIARAFAFVLILAYSFAFGKMEDGIKNMSSAAGFALLLLVVASGVFDGLVNIFFGAVINVGLVAIGSAIVAGTPILTAVLGRLAFRDKLTTLQKIGFLIAVLGSVAIAVS